ncbi:hypothetical protein D1007_08045 [Hordeum vulgare]|nr:hypothetical protein D1007_08045 [Hordeum vulgare]
MCHVAGVQTAAVTPVNLTRRSHLQLRRPAFWTPPSPPPRTGARAGKLPSCPAARCCRTPPSPSPRADAPTGKLSRSPAARCCWTPPSLSPRAEAPAGKLPRRPPPCDAGSRHHSRLPSPKERHRHLLVSTCDINASPSNARARPAGEEAGAWPSVRTAARDGSH